MLKSYFVSTDKGPYYNINQDHYLVNLDHKLFAVVDGFGGSGIGDVVAKDLVEKTTQVFTRLDHDRDATLKFFFDHRRSIECNFLVNGWLEFHQDLTKSNQEKSLYQRGGASAALLHLKDDKLSLITVGKIYALLLRGSDVIELNIADEGQSFEGSADELSTDFWPKSGFGLFDPLNFVIKDFRIFENDQIILLSMGALKGISKSKLAELSQEADDKGFIRSLMQTANENGNRENQTAMILKF